MSEFTTELNPNTSESVVLRGGNYNNYNLPAGRRYDNSAGYSVSNERFSRHFVLKVALMTVTAP